MKNKTILKMCILAVSIALYFILARFTISVGNMRFSLSSIPVVVIALVYGPLDALIVGVCGAFIGQMLKYGFSVTTILWIAPPGIRGLIVGLFNKKIKLLDHPIAWIIVVFSACIIVTCCNTFVMYIDSIIFHYYSKAYIFGEFGYRILISLITAVILIIICPLVARPLLIVLNKDKKSIDN